MANTPIYQIGNKLSSAILRHQTVSAAGVIADDVPNTYTITTIIEDIDVQLRKVLEEIGPVNAGMENHVPYIDSMTFSVAILKAEATGGVQKDPDELFDLILDGTVGNYWKLEYVIGTVGGSQETVTLIGVVEDYSGGIHGRGRQTATMRFQSIEIAGGGAEVLRVVA